MSLYDCDLDDLMDLGLTKADLTELKRSFLSESDSEDTGDKKSKAMRNRNRLNSEELLERCREKLRDKWRKERLAELESRRGLLKWGEIMVNDVPRIYYNPEEKLESINLFAAALKLPPRQPNESTRIFELRVMQQWVKHGGLLLDPKKLTFHPHPAPELNMDGPAENSYRITVNSHEAHDLHSSEACRRPAEEVLAEVRATYGKFHVGFTKCAVTCVCGSCDIPDVDVASEDQGAERGANQEVEE